MHMELTASSFQPVAGYQAVLLEVQTLETLMPSMLEPGMEILRTGCSLATNLSGSGDCLGSYSQPGLFQIVRCSEASGPIEVGIYQQCSSFQPVRRFL